jgi:hypothetical protein
MSEPVMELRFTDGVVVDTSGPLRRLELHDGLYVVGEGCLIPSKDEAEVRAMLETADRFTWREGDLEITYDPREAALVHHASPLRRARRRPKIDFPKNPRAAMKLPPSKVPVELG